MLDVLKEVQLTDAQVEALDHFFAEHTKNIRSEIESDFQSEIELLKEENEQLKANPINEGAESAKEEIETLKANATKAFELFKEDASKAFELFKADLKQEYSENMVEALQKLYTEMDERVREDFKSSEEYKAFMAFVEIAKPLVLKEKESLFEEIERLKAEKQTIEQEKESLAKKDTITTLLESFPKEHAEDARAFLEAADSEEEIYERFETFGKLVKKIKASTVTQVTESVKPVVVEPKKPAAKKPAAPAAPIFESTTTKTEPKEVAKKSEGISEEDLIHFLNHPLMMS
jgi:hypothetical protein